MAKVTVDTTVSRLPVAIGETPVIQNLGPGVLYLDTSSSVSVTTGLRVPVDGAYEWPRDVATSVYAVASAAGTDVRILKVG